MPHVQPQLRGKHCSLSRGKKLIQNNHRDLRPEPLSVKGASAKGWFKGCCVLYLLQFIDIYFFVVTHVKNPHYILWFEYLFIENNTGKNSGWVFLIALYPSYKWKQNRKKWFANNLKSNKLKTGTTTKYQVFKSERFYCFLKNICLFWILCFNMFQKSWDAETR